MPGTITIRPVEAKFTHDHDVLSKMDPYCTVHVGSQKVKGQVCKSGGKNPHWKDSITVQRGAEPTMIIELKDKDTFTKDDLIGVCQVDLNSLESKNNISRWYPVFNNKQPAGEILIDITYTPLPTKYPLSNQMQQGPSTGTIQPNYPSNPQQGGMIGGQMHQGPTHGAVQQTYPSGGQHGGMIPNQTQHMPNTGGVQPNYPSNVQHYPQMNQGPTSGGSNPNVIPPQFNAQNTQPAGFGQPNYAQQQFPQGGYPQQQGQMIQGQGYPQQQGQMMQDQGGYPQQQGQMMQGQGGCPQGGAYHGSH